MEPVSLPALPRVAFCGGTHGNELSGVYLVRQWQKKKKLEAESVAVTTVMSNPRAVQQCRRYVEKDLNRCFTTATLSTPVSGETPYEVVRAQELNALLGPKGSDGAMDLICDLHNTTANMGLCLISNSDCDWICLHIYKYLQMKTSSVPVRLLNLNVPPEETYFLASVGKHSLSIEIGPQPHGLVRADILSAMKEGVQLMLEWIQLFNSGTEFEGGVVEVYTAVQNIDYPRDSETHDITGVIHPQLQDRDFCLLHPGDPLFLLFSGETERYGGEEPLYALFVNESAYYEKGTALTLARRKRVEIPPLRVKRD
ncbi:N-acyl-aromatic-L-amino acid amidohydrolase (carboxylate-forming) B-like [Megalops cyprinoides]|uniref:N-acyl-aromatic-L-amino acid amidohydrolase (carboxylate-forming) B-like n=1 Tax=Megalops cyprinoides TaxID=118141 RepID=UPI001864D7D3|nr:N-acyl-aromatic-L-amino acid amidohydrolase (carboxylate-forming) B-like [Megalops cyprinoides]